MPIKWETSRRIYVNEIKIKMNSQPSIEVDFKYDYKFNHVDQKPLKDTKKVSNSNGMWPIAATVYDVHVFLFPRFITINTIVVADGGVIVDAAVDVAVAMAVFTCFRIGNRICV